MGTITQVTDGNTPLADLVSVGEILVASILRTTPIWQLVGGDAADDAGRDGYLKVLVGDLDQDQFTGLVGAQCGDGVCRMVVLSRRPMSE